MYPSMLCKHTGQGWNSNGSFQADMSVPVRHCSGGGTNVRAQLVVTFEQTERKSGLGMQNWTWNAETDHIHVFTQRRRRTNIRAQAVVSFEEAAKGAKRTIRVAQGVPTPQNVDIEIPAGNRFWLMIRYFICRGWCTMRLWFLQQL
jgi:hypothetical protein